MADNPLKIYDFGTGGVNVDSTPLQMRDNELRLAQNAIHRTIKGRRGALCNRNGLKRFTTSPLDGSVLGGIEMPVADTGGAPSSGGGGGGTGTAIPGINSDNLGAGLSIDSSVNAGGSSPAGASFGQSGQLFGGARLIIIGRVDDNQTSDTQQGHGWYLTSKSLADNGLKVTTGSGGCVIGPPGFPTNVIRPTAAEVGMMGQNAYTYANGVLFFGEAIAELRGTDPIQPTLFRYDGHNQTTVTQFPVNSILHTAGTSYRSSIVNVLVKYADGNTLYVAVADDVLTTGSATGYHGRIYKITGLDAQSYVVTEIFNSAYSGNASGFVSAVATNSYTPYALENFGGALWFGMWRGNGILNSDLNPTVAKLIESGTHGVISSAQTINHTSTNQSDITVMKRMFGSLFFGTRDFYNTAVGPSGPPQFASIYKLDPDGTLTLSKSINDGGTAASQNLVVSMAEFNGNLYVSAYNGTAAAETSIIYKYDGSSWTTVFTQGAGTKTPFNLAVDDGVIYAFGSIGSTSTNTRFYVSSDGASWTEKTFDDANFDSHDHVLNFLYGFNQ